ncbi:hypothetical protein EYF80_052052 [Liparis tanakae]|uniref:Uncharacterized protein n=1 Tax=Liparis tanakae TaxID=230148 RepID=A0A4Z2FBL9_9TELE|nr:hypothetical protein EYF80_052052 [Liparis tanakae]
MKGCTAQRQTDTVTDAPVNVAEQFISKEAETSLSGAGFNREVRGREEEEGKDAASPKSSSTVW